MLWPMFDCHAYLSALFLLLPCLMMICYAMIRWMLGWYDMYTRWMLGWCDMYARWMLGDAMLDVCQALFYKHDRCMVRDDLCHVVCLDAC